MKMTVIIRNDSPLLLVGDSPSYRRVTIEMTPQQEEALKLRKVGVQAGQNIYEEYSHCFLEKED